MIVGYLTACKTFGEVQLLKIIMAGTIVLGIAYYCMDLSFGMVIFM